jgi:hypothetical protein
MQEIAACKRDAETGRDQRHKLSQVRMRGQEVGEKKSVHYSNEWVNMDATGQAGRDGTLRKRVNQLTTLRLTATICDSASRIGASSISVANPWLNTGILVSCPTKSLRHQLGNSALDSAA